MTTLVVIVIVSAAALLAAGVTAAVYRRRPDRVADRVDADRAARLAADLQRAAADRAQRRAPRPLDDAEAPLFQPDPAQVGTAGTASDPTTMWGNAWAGEGAERG